MVVSFCNWPLPAILLLSWLCISTTGCSSSPSSPKASPSSEQSLQFTDVTKPAGLKGFRHETGAVGEKWMPESMGSGGGFIDYNGDGWDDILLVGGGSWQKKAVQPLQLYRNNGDGTFTEQTQAAGLAKVDAYGIGIAAADYDNDEDQDFIFTTLAKNMLFRNDGGAFSEVGMEAGIANQSTWSSSAIFFDANQDGWLDLYVGNYVKWSPKLDRDCFMAGEKAYCTPDTYEGAPSRFYLNNGNGTFTDQTEEAGFLPAPGKTLGVAAFDVNQDRWPDLVVANDLERNLLYQNNGDGTFAERGTVAGVAFNEHGETRAGMGIDIGVVDSTGAPTIFVGNFSNEMIGVFRHSGNGFFNDRAAASQIGQPSLLTLAFGLFLFDADLDADLDLFVGNGHMQPRIEQEQQGIHYRQSPHFFLNNGNGRFKDVAGKVGAVFQQALVIRGAAYADYDHDGDQDILLTENGGPAHLWRNARKQGNYLRVRLKGTKSNRDGIGTRLVAVSGKLRQERRLTTGASYLSQSEKAVTFGLGKARQVDSLLVYWPSETVERLAKVAANQEVLVTEGKGLQEITAVR